MQVNLLPLWPPRPQSCGREGAPSEGLLADGKGEEGGRPLKKE